jgi:ribose transport system substrate-binding protein
MREERGKMSSRARWRVATFVTMVSTIVATGPIGAVAAVSAASASARGAVTHVVANDSALKKCLFGFSAPYLNNPAVAVAATLAIAQAKKDGLKTLPIVNANEDPTLQYTQIQDLVTEGATCIMVDPDDSKAIIPALDWLKSKHITTVAIDIGSDGGPLSIMVRADNVTMAYLSCENLMKIMHGKGTVLEMRGNLSDLNGSQRDQGFRECAKQYPSVKVIPGEQTLWSPETAEVVAADELTASPSITGIFMASDGNMWAGVSSALTAHHRLIKIGDPGHVAVTGIDGTPAALTSIRQGYLDGTVEQPFNLYAIWGLWYLIQAYNGHTAPFHIGPTSHGPVDTFDGDLVNLVPASFVDKSNVNSPDWWGNQVTKSS